MISKFDSSLVDNAEDTTRSALVKSEDNSDLPIGHHNQQAWIDGWKDSANHLAESFDATCAFIIELPQALNLSLTARYVCSCGHLKHCIGHVMDDPLILETINSTHVMRQEENLSDHPFNRIIPKCNLASFLAVTTKSRLNGSGYVFGVIGRTPWPNPVRTIERLEGMAYFASQLMCSKTDALEADLFFQMSQDAIMRVCSDGTIVKINKNAEKLTGFKNNELSHQSISRIFPGLKSNDLSRMSYDCILSANSSASHQCQNVVKLQTNSGDLQVVELTISGLIPNQSGSNDVIVMLRDRSEHEKLETMVKQVSDFSNEILCIVGAYVFVIDHQGRIVRFNQECERITGELFEEVVGLPLWEVIPEALSHKRQLERYRKNPDHFMGPSSHKGIWKDKDGKKHHIQWRN